MYKRHAILFALTVAGLWGANALADSIPKALHGTIYVPAAYQQHPFTTADGGVNQFILSRLIIRNTDMGHTIILNSARFYGPDGVLVHEFVNDPIGLPPLASTSFLTQGSALGIPPYPVAGGRPSFIVEWTATNRVNKPIIEALHVLVQPELTASSLHGISIIPGQEIR